MPKYHLTSPDGHTYEIDAPDGATEEDAIKYIQSNNIEPTEEQAQLPEKGPINRFMSGVGSQILRAQGAMMPSFVDSGNDFQKEADIGAQNATGTLGEAGKLVGSSLPFVMLPGGGIANTAMQSGLLSAATTPGNINERLQNAGNSAIASALLGGATKMIGGFAPSAEAKAMMEEGIQPTLGQGIKQNILGRSIRKVEEAAKSIPIIGDMAAAARDRSKSEWAIAKVKKAEIPELGVTTKGQSGYDAIDSLHKTFSKAYTKNLEAHDIPRTATLDQLITNAAPEGSAAAQIIAKEASILPPGKVNASDFHRVIGTLRDIGSRYKKSVMASEQDTGIELSQAANKMRNYLLTNIPNDAAKNVSKLDSKYGIFKTLQEAAKSLGAEGGNFNGAQLLNAVKKSDITKDKSAFARGAARLQQDAVSAKKILGDTLSESGTSTRSNVGLALSGTSAWFIPKLLATIPAAAVLQARPVQKALLGGYDKQAMIADIVNKLTEKPTLGYINEKRP